MDNLLETTVLKPEELIGQISYEELLAEMRV